MKLKDAIEKFTKFSHAGNERGTGTIKGYENYLMHFCLFLRNPLITQIYDENITDYFNLMKELGWKVNSLVARSIAFKKFFVYWKRKGYPVLDPELIPVVKKEFVMPHVAKDEEVKKVLDLMPRFDEDLSFARDRAIVNLLKDSGMRCGEMMSLTISDIKKCHALIRTEKNKISKPVRKVFWSKETDEDIQHWIKVRDSFRRSLKMKDHGFLFVGLKSKYRGVRMTQSGVNILMRKYSKKAGLKKTLNPHSLRHKFGHDLNAAGANNSTISSLMGHSTMNSSFIYTMMDNKEMEEAYVKFKKPSKGLDKML